MDSMMYRDSITEENRSGEDEDDNHSIQRINYIFFYLMNLCDGTELNLAHDFLSNQEQRITTRVFDYDTTYSFVCNMFSIRYQREITKMLMQEYKDAAPWKYADTSYGYYIIECVKLYMACNNTNNSIHENKIWRKHATLHLRSCLFEEDKIYTILEQSFQYGKFLFHLKTNHLHHLTAHEIHMIYTQFSDVEYPCYRLAPSEYQLWTNKRK